MDYRLELKKRRKIRDCHKYGEVVKNEYKAGEIDYIQASSRIVGYLNCMMDINAIDEDDSIEIYRDIMDKLDS